MPILKEFGIENFVNNVSVDGLDELDTLNESILEHEWTSVNQVIRVQSRHIGRPDRIADETIGSPVYWWVVYLANNIDPFDGLEVGDVLVIPTPSEIFEVLENFRQR